MEDKKRIIHRVRSATATFQKGIYHLFMLEDEKTYDAFDNVLRIYQSVFLLGIAQVLLDFDKQPIDPKKVRFADKDPAAGVQHGMVKDWPGFESGHPLHDVSKRTHDIFNRVIDARHNLIYRPLYLDTNQGWYWEDCTLKDLLRDIPTISEIKEIYKDFFEAIENWEANATPEEELWLPFFKIFTFQKFRSSNKTLLAAYTHLLNPNAPELEEQTKEYSIKLLGEKIREWL